MAGTPEIAEPSCASYAIECSPAAVPSADRDPPVDGDPVMSGPVEDGGATLAPEAGRTCVDVAGVLADGVGCGTGRAGTGGGVVEPGDMVVVEIVVVGVAGVVGEALWVLVTGGLTVEPLGLVGAVVVTVDGIDTVGTVGIGIGGIENVGTTGIGIDGIVIVGSGTGTKDIEPGVSLETATAELASGCTPRNACSRSASKEALRAIRLAGCRTFRITSKSPERDSRYVSCSEGEVRLTLGWLSPDSGARDYVFNAEPADHNEGDRRKPTDLPRRMR
ncbi:MAG TPA: hypothetical protein VME22_15155 [Solirubrobacteraceae bacterium]|nr:hypothetical protein [Solirubrobacteraceae bacterium]